MVMKSFKQKKHVIKQHLKPSSAISAHLKRVCEVVKTKLNCNHLFMSCELQSEEKSEENLSGSDWNMR